MRMGPPKLPEQLKILRGTNRPDRNPQSIARPTPKIPKCPEFISPFARKEFKRVVRQLYKLGLVADIDMAILACYCEAFSDLVDATRMCATIDQQDRKVIRTPAGNLVENPYYSIKKRSMELTLRFAGELGIGASSRSGIEALPMPNPTTDHSNPFARLRGAG